MFIGNCNFLDSLCLAGALALLALEVQVEKIHKTKVLKTVLRGHTIHEVR